MCTTSETCRANSVIKTALNNLHQAGPNKTHTYTVYQVHYVITDLRRQIRKDLQFQLICSLLGHLKILPQLR